MSHHIMPSPACGEAPHCATPFSNVSSRAGVDYSLTLRLVARLFEGRSFLSFKDIEAASGLSFPEIINLKQDLIVILERDVTSRIDLADSGFYVED